MYDVVIERDESKQINESVLHSDVRILTTVIIADMCLKYYNLSQHTYTFTVIIVLNVLCIEYMVTSYSKLILCRWYQNLNFRIKYLEIVFFTMAVYDGLII